MERLTERRDGQWVIPLRKNEEHEWALTQSRASCGDSTRYLYGDHANRLAAYEDTGLEPNEISNFIVRYKRSVEIAELCKKGGIEHMLELKKAEQDGRLVVLPCKVGDTVYEPNKRGFISTYKVVSIHLSTCSLLIGWDLIDGIYSNVNGFEASALGKTVFLTLEEAEAAMEGGDD